VLEDKYEEARELLNKVRDDPRFSATFPLLAGMIAHRSKEYDKARQLYLEALENSQKENNTFLLGASLTQMSALQLSMNNISEAQKYIQESLQHAQQSNQHDLELYNFLMLGDIVEGQGDYHKAEEYYLTALEVARKYTPAMVRQILSRLARNTKERGEHGEALRYALDLVVEVERVEGEEGLKRLKDSLGLGNATSEP
jgi:tetratricopeptide (TPR) repeat protein